MSLWLLCFDWITHYQLLSRWIILNTWIMLSNDEPITQIAWNTKINEWVYTSINITVSGVLPDNISSLPQKQNFNNNEKSISPRGKGKFSSARKNGVPVFLLELCRMGFLCPNTGLLLLGHLVEIWGWPTLLPWRFQ